MAIPYFAGCFTLALLCTRAQFMSLSLNPADIWKIFSDGKQRNKEELANWLDAVAADARKLADVWIETTRLLSKSELTVGQEIDIDLRLGGPNAAPFRRLTQFYETASTVIGGRVDDRTRMDFSQAVGTLLLNRNSAMRLCGTITRTLGGMKLLVDDANSLDNMAEFNGIIVLLNREAAALEVLAKNFRASA
jgi:hypothetical protein